MRPIFGFFMPGVLEILIIAVPLGGIAALCIFFYLMSVSSRKHYRCPSCGEAITTEYLDAGYCSKCGTPLQRE